MYQDIGIIVFIILILICIVGLFFNKTRNDLIIPILEEFSYIEKEKSKRFRVIYKLFSVIIYIMLIICICLILASVWPLVIISIILYLWSKLTIYIFKL